MAWRGRAASGKEVPFRSSSREPPMADKSPHQDHTAKKSGKATKAKRSERKEQQRAATEMERLMHPRRTKS
jgi:hypothetical protein